MLTKSSVAGVNGIEPWMFGSALVSGDPGDIDLLLVYDSSIFSLERAIKTRRAIADLVAEATGLAADVLLLTQREVDQTGIVDRFRAVRIG
ncbi:MAG: hypothetical protein IPM64_01340 [Phycisphaerales bacterium]|nr:hypothetical protein [Phycisphaerales bacterium]